MRRALESTGATSVIAIAFVVVVFELQSGLFLSGSNVGNLLIEIVPLVLVGLAESVVILMREIDLSLGSVVGLTAAIGAALMTNSGDPWWVAVLVMCLAGMATGAIQGAVVVWGGAPAFVVTLGGYLVFLGLQLEVLGATGGINVTARPVLDLTISKVPTVYGAVIIVAALILWVWAQGRAIRAAGQRAETSRLVEIAKVAVVTIVAVVVLILVNRGGGIPVAFVITVALLGATATFLKHTAAGRHVYAVGGNPEAARRVGVRVKALRWGGFVVAGLLAACAGLIYISYDQGASSTTGGATLLLQAIGSAVIGGVSLFGGRGSVWGALTGAVVIGGIENGLNLSSASDPTKYVIEGVVVVLAVMLDSVARSGTGAFRLRRRRPAG
jgi:D-xylose transport system permease protein